MRPRPVQKVLFSLVIVKHHNLVPCIYVFPDDHSIIMTDDSVSKDPNAPQEAFRTSPSYK